MGSMLIFVLISAVTIMNMMIGVLVEVVKGASHIEREGMQARTVKECLTKMLSDRLDDGHTDVMQIRLSKQQFMDLVSNPHVARVLHKNDLDVVGLLDDLDTIFRGSDSGNGLLVCDLIHEVLQ